MKPYLSISVGDTATLINYVSDGEVIVSHTHPIGYKHIEAEGMNKVAGGKLLEGVIYTLEFVSLYDRVPVVFRLIAPRYSSWIQDVLSKHSYSQFYTKGLPISVTLEGVQEGPLSYARHPQTIFSFKV